MMNRCIETMSGGKKCRYVAKKKCYCKAHWNLHGPQLKSDGETLLDLEARLLRMRLAIERYRIKKLKIEIEKRDKIINSLLSIH
jgi:hypothetical protein